MQLLKQLQCPHPLRGGHLRPPQIVLERFLVKIIRMGYPVAAPGFQVGGGLKLQSLPFLRTFLALTVIAHFCLGAEPQLGLSPP